MTNTRTFDVDELDALARAYAEYFPGAADAPAFVEWCDAQQGQAQDCLADQFERQGLPRDGQILFYARDRRWWECLSNFYPSPIHYDGMLFATAEHLYQALKTTNREARTAFTAPTVSPGRAKAMGRKIDLRPGWDMMRVAVMNHVLALKFKQNAELARRLLATADHVLIEDSPTDAFWGSARNGENMLGRLLMDRRDLLREFDRQLEA